MKSLSRTANKKHFTSAVIAAAGSGTRMESSTTKQLIELCGIPVVARTLLAFEHDANIDEIIVAARPDEIPLYREFAEKYKIDKLTEVVAGGETRQESVLRGFEKISDKSEFVAIHDGARCLITTDTIDKVLRAAYSWGAATAASHISDTVKRGGFGDFIERPSTARRSGVCRRRRCSRPSSTALRRIPPRARASRRPTTICSSSTSAFA